MTEPDMDARVNLSEPAPAPTSRPKAQAAGASLAGVDRVRFTKLVDTQLDFVWRTIRRLGLPAAEADDAAQQVFLVAARRLDDIEEGAERSFLYKSAVLTVRNVRRARARRPEDAPGDMTETPDPTPSPEDVAEHRSARRLLDEALEQIDDDAREVFVLFEIEGTSMPDIAALLDIPEGTCASRLRRAREQFQAAAKRLRAREEFSGKRGAGREAAR